MFTPSASSQPQVLPHSLSPKSLPCPLLNPVSDTNMHMDVGHPLDHCQPTRYPTTLKETDVSPLEASIVNSTLGRHGGLSVLSCFMLECWLAASDADNHRLPEPVCAMGAALSRRHLFSLGLPVLQLMNHCLPSRQAYKISHVLRGLLAVYKCVLNHGQPDSSTFWILQSL